jgi:hypothetical protein
VKRWQRYLLITATVLLLLGGSGFAYWRHRYPYGWSHCCDIGLYADLRAYAESHDGRFPAGESSPEASLSLLYRGQFTEAAILRGKTVPESVVTQRLISGQLLSPDTCGWHYVEGLSTNADRRIALFWDKIPLGHNGERLADGSRCVILVSGERRIIPASEWQGFLAEQQQLLSSRAQ